MIHYTLQLSREGIFPIVESSKKEMPTGLRCSGTIQGEGKLAGVPSLFVRLQGCNLMCKWKMEDGSVSVCDTAHTWPLGRTETPVVEIYNTLMRNLGQIRHVVITGGEPYLQHDGLLELLEMLGNAGVHTTVETNGTLEFVDLPQIASLTSLSPKLKRSGICREMRLQTVESTTSLIDAALLAGKDVQLKFVVSCADEEREIKKDYADALRMLKPTDVIVMPLGATAEVLERTRGLALEMAVRNGWRYGPRLHIDLFGNRERT